MNVGALCEFFETIAPLRYAEAWDNVGLLFGDPADEVSSVLLCVDLTAAVLAEARSHHAELVFAYHPPLFRPEKRFLAGDVPFECMRAGVSVYSPHTALDVAPGGTNDFLADALGLSGCAPLRVTEEGVGMGRVGDVPNGVTAGALARDLRSKLGLSGALVASVDETRKHQRIAVLAGSGGDFLADARAAGATLLVTGELRHHDALAALRQGLDVVSVLHSNSERHAVAALLPRIAAAFPGLKVTMSSADRDPFAFA